MSRRTETTDDDALRFEALSRRLRAAPGDYPDVAAVARASGSTARELEACFVRHAHETAADFLRRARTDWAAARLLTTSQGPRDIALDAGFADRERFEADFVARHRMTPLCYRSLADGRRFVLSLPADFRHRDTLRQLGRDADATDQKVDGTRVGKGLWLAGRPAALHLRLGHSEVACEVSVRGRCSPDLMAEAHAAALRLLGLNGDPDGLQRRARRDRDQRRLIGRHPGLRVMGNGSPFEALCWSIVGQQVNLAFAFRCRRSLFELARVPSIAGLQPHPTPADIASVDPGKLRARQFSGRKIEYLRDTATMVDRGTLPLDELSDASAVRAERVLLDVRGIGPWSANYVMMRGSCFADCAPIGDTGIRSALQRWLELDERPDAALTIRLLEPFAPHRSLACWHLWRSLDPSEREEEA